MGLNFYVKKQDEGQWIDNGGTEFLIRRATNEETMTVAEASRKAKASDDMDYKSQLKPVEKVVLAVWKGTRRLTITPGDEDTVRQMKESGFPSDVAVDQACCVDEHLNDNVKRFILREDPAFPDLLNWISEQSAELRRNAQKHEAELGKA